VSSTVGARTRLAVLARWVNAYNAHDVEAMCAVSDPAIEIIPLGEAITAPPGTTYHGHAGLRTLMQAGFDRFPNIRIDHDAPEEVGQTLVARIHFVLDDGSAAPIYRDATGVYVFDGDRIRRVEAYHNSDDAWRAAEQPDGLLSPREREILTLLAGGDTAESVAGELVLSPYTVRTHVRNIKDKLGARTTAHAIAIAMRRGDLGA
jgi:DNA-binding CsgD family transcriptional regulator